MLYKYEEMAENREVMTEEELAILEKELKELPTSKLEKLLLDLYDDDWYTYGKDIYEHCHYDELEATDKRKVKQVAKNDTTLYYMDFSAEAKFEKMNRKKMVIHLLELVNGKFQ